jgi:hypothetical protein
LAKRALLYDHVDQFVGYRSFAEIDDYMARGWIERLTPIKSPVHAFRLFGEIKSLVQRCRRSAASLNSRIMQANAGAAEWEKEIVWARRKVRAWPFVGDTKAPCVRCRASMITLLATSRQRDDQS